MLILLKFDRSAINIYSFNILLLVIRLVPYNEQLSSNVISSTINNSIWNATLLLNL